ncbi:putative glucan 4-alpha-glucosidase [Diaporthe ampelina]|uniref:Putative glucan 4-alpha-glucosidase n=1 Tax=Diaporthe ampelina TaxID=1214573 RepID=A0A0G2FTK1_9PEZI|nr:putative glucan 4-alpha-glucosidase [Diaporthe ampelina]
MSAHQNPPKRPRLSLQIKTIANGPNLRGSRTVAAAVNPTSPTAFNTLSNVYVTAIDRATPVTAINTSASQPLKIQTQDLSKEQHHGSHTPYAPSYLDTPLTAQPLSPRAAAPAPVQFPSTMTATPPLSSGPVDDSDPKPFSFSAEDTAGAAPGASSGTSWTPGGFHPSSASVPTGSARRRATLPLSVSSSSSSSSSSSGGPLPYVRNRSLHSILRNSPLPPPTARTPISPRRQSLRLAEKAARRVGYGSPIEQEITTNEYVRSHIDLLADEVSPRSASSPSSTTAAAAGGAAGVSSPNDQMVLDMTMAYTGDETRDGGQTPGPFEEMRRRMAGLVTRTPTSPTVPSSSSPSGGIRKRRKTRETKRRWVWTIGTQDDDADDREVGGAIAAIRAAARAQAEGQPRTTTDGGAAASAAASSASASACASAAMAPPPVVVEPGAHSPMEIPTPSIETFDEAAQEDVVMSESDAEPETEAAGGAAAAAAALAASNDMEVDLVTPTVARRNNNAHLRSVRQDSEGLFNSETGSRRDTPIPADLISHAD